MMRTLSSDLLPDTKEEGVSKLTAQLISLILDIIAIAITAYPGQHAA